MTKPWHRAPAAVATLLGLAVLAVYARTLGFAFVDWDDPTYVTENAAVQAGLTWRGLVWAFTTFHAGNWHPLTWLSHMLDQTLFGSWAGGHHLTSVLLHAVNVALVYLLFERTTRATGRSAVVAGLFALHPLHVESVAWVSERKDVLSTCCALLALHAYADWASTRRARSYGLALAAFALAALAKPMVVTLPGLLVLLDLWPLRRLRAHETSSAAPAPGSRASRRAAARAGSAPPARAGTLRGLVLEKVPFVLVALALSAVTLGAQHGAVAESAALPGVERVGNALVSYVAYLGATIWPAGLAFFYPYREHLDVWAPLGAGVLLVGATIMAVRLARTRPYVTVGWLWYLGTLVPVIGLVQAGDQAMADRFTYLPLVGIFVIVAWGAVDLTERRRLPAATLPVVAASALAACALASVRQAGTWRTSVALFEHALAVTRDNYVAHNLLGYVLYVEGRPGEAAEHFAAAVAARPTMHEAHNNLGLAFAAQGRWADAVPHYRDALRVRPGYATAGFNLAIALDHAGAGAGATEEAERALAAARRQGDGALAGQIVQWLGSRRP